MLAASKCDSAGDSTGAATSRRDCRRAKAEERVVPSDDWQAKGGQEGRAEEEDAAEGCPEDAGPHSHVRARRRLCPLHSHVRPAATTTTANSDPLAAGSIRSTSAHSMHSSRPLFRLSPLSASTQAT